VQTNKASHTPPPPINSRYKITAGIFLGIVLFFLLAEHRAHVFGVLPYLLLAACPLMHLFMHGGHGHHGGGTRDKVEGNEDQP
jgi:hypothetical protein